MRRASPDSAGGESPVSVAIWPHYRDNLARHLIGVARDLQGRVQQALAEHHGHRDLRPSFAPFLTLLWEEGRPLRAVATELGISNQACSQLANLVEAAGYLERRPNPHDRRSKLVRLTPRGRALAEQGVRLILEREAEYAALVGPGSFRRFTGALAAVYRALDLPAHADPALLARAGRSAGLLPPIAVRIQRELMEETAARGHAGLKMSYGQVLPLIGPDGGRIHEIARLQRVTRQAISATTLELERKGYLRREPDPRDRRSVVLRLSERCAALIRDSVAALDALEARFRDALGETRLEQLREVARGLYRALRLEQEIFEPRAAARPATDAPGGLSRAGGGSEIERLARRLRRRLGSGDAARLAALLEPPAWRTLP